ncbi:FAD-binding protein [Allosaccharopolyspora coralli]|uniref:FAD-binding protein n=1 Tax=Allosaccharopolyspora coralli TaxID=2665642 RepID=A0A5Q3QA96_9PSEU|nr:FAD-binding protein [Allosaccharopolyspora coralli]QGK70114.1 FAD-binding protein [Allosaccharopolyspora coralli]
MGACAAPEPNDAWPAVGGSLDEDEHSLDWAATDWGGLLHRRPRAVLRPNATSDIARLASFCRERGLTLRPRGQGHSLQGRAQAHDGVVVDMRATAAIGEIHSDRVEVEAGALWSDVLAATLPHGLAPPVFTDYIELTVGGTLSVGGIGGATHRHGMQTDNVLAMQVMTHDGETRPCSPERNAALFDAVRAGYGRHGTILRATLRLTEAFEHTRVHTVRYQDRSVFLQDQRMLVASGAFDHVQGHVLPDEDGWSFFLVAAQYGTSASSSPGPLLDSLRSDNREVDDLPHGEFLHRLRPQEQFLRATGAWHRAHPWLDLFLPDSAADGFLDEVMDGLRPDDLGEGGLVLLYPFPTRVVRTPALMLPREPTTYLVSLLRTAPADGAAIQHMLDENARLRSIALERGATLYL